MYALSGSCRRVAQFQRFSVASSIPRFFGSKADFGFKDVNAEDKERMVRDVFSKVAEKYDVMNDVMSFGTHRLWKDELISMMGINAAAKANPQYIPRHLDVAGGTGDVAFRSLNQILTSYGNHARNLPLGEEATEKQVVVCDINPEMLAVGKQRATKLYRGDELNMVRTILQLLLCLYCIVFIRCDACINFFFTLTRAPASSHS